MNTNNSELEEKKWEHIANLHKGYCERNHAFCSDCRDKLPQNTCHRCYWQKLEAQLTTKDQEITQLKLEVERLVKHLKKISLTVDCAGPYCKECETGADHKPSYSAKLAQAALTNHKG